MSSSATVGKVLILSTLPAGLQWEPRREALRRLCGPGHLVDFAGRTAKLSDRYEYSFAIVDPDPPVGDWLMPWVELGGSMLVIGSGTGASDATTLPTLPTGGLPSEWIVKVNPDHPATARLPAEFVLRDQFQPVPRLSQEEEVVAWVNVGFRDEPAIVTRRVGAGRITTSGLGADTAALGDPELSALLRRCLVGTTQAGRSATVGLGIVGYGPYGGMGQRHGLAAAATDGLELVAAADSDQARRKAAEADFPGLAAYASSDELAADEDVSAVIVATPPVSHASLALALLEAGKHVILEKPMCLTVAEADRLIALARSNDLALTVHQNRRWDPDYRAILAVLEAGWLGELFACETFVGSFEHPCRAWHSEESISGGAIYDWGSHHLDWALQLMGGPPARVSAHAHKRVWHDVTNADQVRVHLSWADGREALFVQSDVAGIRKPKFYLQGTAGTLEGHYRPIRTERVEAGRGYVREIAHHAEAPVELTVARYEAGLGLTETTIAPLPELRFPFHANLADHLLLGEPLAVTPESVRSVIAVLEAATASAAQAGAPVQIAS
ncbi:MAG: Gfo/Idh/MocA family oxidoreductase [Acidimicrobiales bacterium]